MSTNADNDQNADDTRDSDGPLLELEDVSVEFKDPTLVEQAFPKSLLDRFDLYEKPVQALDDVSLEIGEEDVVVLVGESGSGKSTLGRTAIGIEEPTAGTVRYEGYDLQELQREEHADEILSQDARRALQIVHQDPSAALNPYRTVRSTLSQPLKLWYPELDVGDRRERIRRMLEKTGITPAEEYMERYPYQLSGGEKQRIAIIRSVLVEPDLILADEVVSALDVSLRVDVMDLLLELREMFGTAFLFVSHNLTNARYFAGKADGRIAVMYFGKIVEMGPAEEVLQNPKHPYTKTLKWASLPLDPNECEETIRDESPMMSDEQPDPSDLPEGCRFQASCPKAREVCQRSDPELVSEDDSDDHTAACFRELPDHEYWSDEPIHEAEPDILQ
ncbi:ABC transporter ATP-binding protein [Halomontanus rarus]|uniref:ABC transporter ATP-binding protein n=1 Tax=Halomontanus rarus TaxID=3034020 RepID=UPI00293BDA65|nr:ABC transporter ATP-binding protein [Halovivax sp. KZCA124]